MSAKEKESGVAEKELYNSPEIVRLDDALQLTEGSNIMITEGTWPSSYYDPAPDPLSPEPPDESEEGR